MIYLNLLLIAVIVVIIIDISGIIEDIKCRISKILTKGKIAKTDYRLKPFDCSFCMNFWVGLIFIILIGQFSILLLAYILLLSVLTPVIKETILLIKDTILKIINIIYEKFID